MFLTIPFNMFYYIALKYGNFLLETLDTFPLLKDAYTQSRKLYENRISSWYGALQQILNNIPKLKQLSTNQKVSKQTVKKILLEAHRHQWALDRNKCSDGKLRTYVKFKTVYGRESYHFEIRKWPKKYQNLLRIFIETFTPNFIQIHLAFSRRGFLKMGET
jgi:hypothetical protein